MEVFPLNNGVMLAFNWAVANNQVIKPSYRKVEVGVFVPTINILHGNRVYLREIVGLTLDKTFPTPDGAKAYAADVIENRKRCIKENVR